MKSNPSPLEHTHTQKNIYHFKMCGSMWRGLSAQWYNLPIHLSPSFLPRPLHSLGHFYPQHFLWGAKGNHRPHQ